MEAWPPRTVPEGCWFTRGRRGMSYSPKPPAKQSRTGVSSQACSRSRRRRRPFPRNSCSTRNVRNTSRHHCCCRPERCLIPWHSCPSSHAAWMQLRRGGTGTVVLSVWESNLMINRALSKTGKLPKQLPAKCSGSKIRHYYFFQ